MPPLDEIKDVYLVTGIGGMSFIALVFVLYFLLKSLIPTVDSLKDIVLTLRQDSAINTRAIEELAKSNENVATALNLVKHSMTNVETEMNSVQTGLEKVLESNEECLKHLIIIDTKVSSQTNN